MPVDAVTLDVNGPALSKVQHGLLRAVPCYQQGQKLGTGEWRFLRHLKRVEIGFHSTITNIRRYLVVFRPFVIGSMGLGYCPTREIELKLHRHHDARSFCPRHACLQRRRILAQSSHNPSTMLAPFLSLSWLDLRFRIPRALNIHVLRQNPQLRHLFLRQNQFSSFQILHHSS